MHSGYAFPQDGRYLDASSDLTSLRAAITAACRIDEAMAVQRLLAEAPRDGIPHTATRVAETLVRHVREARRHASGVDALMHEFSLSSAEGVALMCLAEALLRIPDKATVERLIADKLAGREWQRHLHQSPSLFVNAAAWGLFITGRLVRQHAPHSAVREALHHDMPLGDALHQLIARAGEPVIRKSMQLAMHVLGKQFVAGRTIAEALAAAGEKEARSYRHSYDMLGEAALTAEDAERYTRAYEEAIHAIGRTAQGRGALEGPGISVKLSALHPRYSRAQHTRVLHELLPRLKQLLLLAKHYDIGLSIDAEEADRLELSLDLMAALAGDAALAGYNGFGIVVQAYQKRCPFVIDFLIALARQHRRRFPLRLVKGAYWDTEIKRAQVEGLPGYPVYTRKVYTDVSYLVCARKMLAASDALYPQFATHNAHTLATIHAWAEQAGVSEYEFQCLYGMGETLYDQIVGEDALRRPCRVYAPVGAHDTLLAYLVRRLLENGANTSFVNQIVDDTVPMEMLLADPLAQARELHGVPHPRIPLPQALFGEARRNSTGLDLASEDVLHDLHVVWQSLEHQPWQAVPVLAATISATAPTTSWQEIRNPADCRDRVGQVREARLVEVEQALTSALQDAPSWQATSASERAALLLRAADLLEQHHWELMALAVREAGKTWPNAVGEVREAVDFLRYYAQQITTLPPAAPLGVIACISPWNFPLAIFIGQVSAALAAGNVVLAKPAEQTPLIAYRAVQLLHEAGIPRSALQLLPGPGETIGAQLVADARVDGVLFTGSTEVARAIHRTLAQRMATEGRELALIAETGGQNAMIVDSSALPEQVVQDAITSAFDSAGQRCSALRVLCLQEEIADKVLVMLKGAMRELAIGNPAQLATDVGPVIDDDAQARLQQHIAHLQPQAKDYFQLPLPAACAHGSFVPPTLLEIDALAQLPHEVFGPVLHVLRYRRDGLPALIDAINATGYGLTLGIQSRIDETVDTVVQRARVGNLYVNRNIIGAVVGVQPFGGEGLSGTGPKAGGPWMLRRLQRVSAQDDADFPEPTLHLPGPTGESNTLHRQARGTVLCFAADPEVLLRQVSAVVASGNQPLLLREQEQLLPHLPASTLHAVPCFIALDALRTAPIHLALLDTAGLRKLAVPLAERDGGLVPVLHTLPGTPIPRWRLLSERSVCINTTAAGGNTRLITLEDLPTLTAPSSNQGG